MKLRFTARGFWVTVVLGSALASGAASLRAMPMSTLTSLSTTPHGNTPAHFAAGSHCSAVIWTNLVNTRAHGGTLQKTDAVQGWDAGADSAGVLTSGNGSVQVTADSTTDARMFGLTSRETSPSYTDINYAIELQNDGTLYIYESGVRRAYGGPYKAGDVLKVAVVNSLVLYYRNSTLVYASTMAPTYPLVADAAIRDPGARIASALLCGTVMSLPTATPTNSPVPTNTPVPTYTPTITQTGTPTPLPTCVTTPIPPDTATPTGILATPTPSTTPVPGDLLPDLRMAPLADFGISAMANGCTRLYFSTRIVNVGAGPFELRGQRPTTGTVLMTVKQRIYNSTRGNTLRKLGVDVKWDAGAGSAGVLTSGNGSVQITADSTSYGRIFGLGHGIPGAAFQKLAFGLELQSDGTLYIYESGLYRAAVGTYAVGDVLKVAVENGVVRYYRVAARHRLHQGSSTLLYTSTVAPTYPLRAEAAIRDPLGEVDNAIFCAPTCAPVTWTNLVHASANSFRTVPTTAVMYYAGDGHHHWHVRDLETYKIEPLDNGNQAATGDKHGFCFRDDAPYIASLPGAPSVRQYGGCGVITDLQVAVGLSVGWGDLYAVNLPDQYIDITSLAPGRYRVWVIADANDFFQESHKSNNSTWVDLQLNGGQSFTILRYGPHA